MFRGSAPTPTKKGQDISQQSEYPTRKWSPRATQIRAQSVPSRRSIDRGVSKPIDARRLHHQARRGEIEQPGGNRGLESAALNTAGSSGQGGQECGQQEKSCSQNGRVQRPTPAQQTRKARTQEHQATPSAKHSESIRAGNKTPTEPNAQGRQGHASRCQGPYSSQASAHRGSE